MFERGPQESYLRRVRGALAALPRRYTALLLFAVVALLPYPTTVVPEWSIRVVDGNGAPVVGGTVRETWRDYSLEGDGHEEELLTNRAGYVVFPERKIWAPPLFRVLFTSCAAVSTLAHGSMGPHASLMVPRSSLSGLDCDYEPGRPLCGELRIKD